MHDHATEVAAGARFEFGRNWSHFLHLLNDERIEDARCSLATMLDMDSLQGKRLLDAGSGSGLFSLAARMLGARVHSFDYDPESVACTAELRRRYFPGDVEWTVEEGSVLDKAYLRQLGEFDVVYSWGVLHHTGRMWDALENIIPLARRNGGVVYISIYNDQGVRSTRWRTMKRLYNRFGLLRPLLIVIAVPILWGRGAGRVLLQPWKASRVLRKPSRGMSRWHDLLDWMGGYPFEVAKPEEIFDFYRARGFRLERLKTRGGGLGCNEYVFMREG